ncbi:hypothetical protein ACHAQH_003070 [Verticillium albo-atrum]
MPSPTQSCCSYTALPLPPNRRLGTQPLLLQRQILDRLMIRWIYGPVSKVWPRVSFASSTDLVNWSDPVWADPWGIDPELFHDPVSGKTYLNLMAPNNDADRL